MNIKRDKSIESLGIAEEDGGEVEIIIVRSAQGLDGGRRRVVSVVAKNGA